MTVSKHHIVSFIISGVMIVMSSLFVACLDDNFDRTMNIEMLPLDIIILDKNVPVPGNDGIITIDLVTDTSIQVLWSPASDIETAQGDLVYRLYKSTSNNISTPADAEKNGGIVHDWGAGITLAVATGLSPSTTYFFNVVVRDGDGLMAAYRTVSITTLTNTVFLFRTSTTYQGDLAPPATESVRNDIDNLCMQARLADYPSMPCLNVRAFISISASDDIAGMPGNFGVPTGRKIVGPTGITVAEYWADLLDGSIAVPLSDAGVASNPWWSGSLSDGTFDASDNCSTWMSTSTKGASGKDNKTNADWIAANSPNCNDSQLVLCLCW